MVERDFSKEKERGFPDFDLWSRIPIRLLDKFQKLGF